MSPSLVIKLPGIFITNDGDITLGNNSLKVYFDGIPCILSGRDLTIFLQSLSSNTADKIEIISSPGSSYDASNGSGILNIITIHKNYKWLSGSINLNYGRSLYDKLSPSFSLNGKINKFSWQIQGGFDNIKSSLQDNQTRDFTFFKPNTIISSTNFGINQNKGFYIRPNFNLKFKKSSLSINYSLNSVVTNTTNTTNIYSSDIIKYNNGLFSINSQNTQDLSILYKIKLDTLGKTLEISAYNNKTNLTNNLQNTQIDEIKTYSSSNYNQKINNSYLKYDLFIPINKNKSNIKIGSKFNQLTISSLGKYNFNYISSNIFSSNHYKTEIPFDYNEINFANYAEYTKPFKKLSFKIGVRYEFFQQKRNSSNFSLKKNIQNLFPNIKLLYKLNSFTYAKFSYGKSINVPTFNSMDPNNSNVYDKYSNATGNPFINPNFTDNYEFNFSVFDYLNFTTSFNHSNSLNLMVFNTTDSTTVINQTFKTFNYVNTLSYTTTIPFPFGMLKEGFKYFSKNVNIDEINYLYLITSVKKTSIDNYIGSLNSILGLTLYSQIILPKKYKLMINYYHQSKGTSRIYEFTKPYQYLNISISKSMLNKALNLTLSINDVFNTNQINFLNVSPNLNYYSYRKTDTRSIFLTISYSFGKLNKFERDKLDINIEKKETKTELKIIN